MSEETHYEKMRVCPSCRCQIPALATKCRFCGEEVGKPKEETRKLSIHDLGGEQVYHRAPSGSVMDALEAFRVEETLQRNEEPSFKLLDLGLDPVQPPAADAPSAFDANYRPPAAKPGTSIKKKGAQPSNRKGFVVGVVVSLTAVVALAVFGPGIYASFSKKDVDSTPAYVNRAPGILRNGGPAIDALAAAVEAIDHADSPASRRIADDAMAALDKEVYALLNAAPFSSANLDEASRLATRGAELYPNEVTRRMVEDTKDDNRVYKMVLSNIDSSTGTATFRLNSPGSPEANVQKGSELAGRFKVQSITGTRYVVITDTKRGGRRVKYEVGSLPLPVQ